MQPDWPAEVHQELKKAGVRVVGYVPDAGHRRLIELCQADRSMRAVPLTTEEEGVGLATGAWLGGEKSVVLMQSSGVGRAERAFNLPWHDWLNLKSLVAVSRIICSAALAREDSRGAHYREDYPETGALESSAFTSIAADGQVVMQPVAFTRVRPGESLLKNAA